MFLFCEGQGGRGRRAAAGRAGQTGAANPTSGGEERLWMSEMQRSFARRETDVAKSTFAIKRRLRMSETQHSFARGETDVANPTSAIERRLRMSETQQRFPPGQTGAANSTSAMLAACKTYVYRTFQAPSISFWLRSYLLRREGHDSCEARCAIEAAAAQAKYVRYSGHGNPFADSREGARRGSAGGRQAFGDALDSKKSSCVYLTVPSRGGMTPNREL